VDPARRRDLHARLALYLVVGTVPVVVVGVLAKNAIRGELRALPVIAATLIVVALALAVVERVAKHRRTIEELVLRDAVLIGCAQALALVPGVSRSGITILAALVIGFRRDAAARFSFLLSIPAIAGAGLFEMKHLLHESGSMVPLGIGLLASTVTGYAAIAWLLRFLRTRTMTPFIVYRIALGLLIIALLATGKIR
jgi:undecaprenyl-diphosphatase